MIDGGTTGTAAAALLTAAATKEDGRRGRKKKTAASAVYQLSTATRATLALAAVVLLMSGMHCALQQSHRQLCSRNFINAVLFAHSETCVIIDGSMAFIEATCGYLIKTGVAGCLCVLYGTCNGLVSGGGTDFREEPSPSSSTGGATATASASGGDNWTIARNLATSLSGGAAGGTAAAARRCLPRVH